MSDPVTVEKRIEILFTPLGKGGVPSALPSFGKLTEEFRPFAEKAKKSKSKEYEFYPQPKQSALIATAAVEIWQRGLHSFLISASTTETSPLWSAVSGYYASHYSVRGLAHLLGYYQLYRDKRILRINIESGKLIGRIIEKDASDREHKYYWKIVKKEPCFENDPFFTENREDLSPSDIANRSKANYLDHMGNFPNFKPLDQEKLKARIRLLSGMELSAVPIPNRLNCPDVDNVQLVAYHRIVKFRKFLDNVLGGKNKFWKIHRTPNWCFEYIDFQVTDPDFATARGHQI